MKNILKTKAMAVLCCSFCFVSATLASPPVSQKRQKVAKKQAYYVRPVSRDSLPQNGLFADKLTGTKKISKQNTARNRAALEVERRLALEDPASELYGENSWTNRVNPFAGTAVAIPATCKIDLDGFVFPLKTRRVTSNYGYRSRFGRMHYGTDLSLSVGDTIRAAFDGKVRIRDYEAGGYGNYVVLRHPNGLETVYGHMKRQLVHENQIVHAGDPIGLGGSTGRSTGPHLHFEMRFMGIPLNPAEIIDMAAGVPYDDFYYFRREGASANSYIASHRGGNPGKQKSKTVTYARKETHRIRKGDTLGSIAKQYGTSVAKIRKLNGNISATKLKLGKVIRVK